MMISLSVALVGALGAFITQALLPFRTGWPLMLAWGLLVVVGLLASEWFSRRMKTASELGMRRLAAQMGLLTPEEREQLQAELGRIANPAHRQVLEEMSHQLARYQTEGTPAGPAPRGDEPAPASAPGDPAGM